jgi:quinol monooxygenase YgiN
MTHVLARHRVKDFEGWKQSFDSALEMRKAGGEVSYRLFRTREDPEDLVLLFEFESEDRAKRFFESPELRSKMEESGVLGEPELLFLNPFS